MKNVVSLLILVFLATSAFAAQDSKQLAEEAIAAERAFWQAEVDGDLEVIKEFVSGDFIQITTRPELDYTITRGKNGALAGIEEAMAQGNFGEFEIVEPNAQVYGSTVVLSFSWSQTYLPTDEQPIRSRGIATSIWVKEDDAWKNVHFHWHTRPDKR
jgi:hypothetical protein